MHINYLVTRLVEPKTTVPMALLGSWPIGAMHNWVLDWYMGTWIGHGPNCAWDQLSLGPVVYETKLFNKKAYKVWNSWTCFRFGLNIHILERIVFFE